MIEQQLTVTTYTATEAFVAIPEHVAIATADGVLVATAGPAGDPQSELYAKRLALAPQMLA